MGFFRNYSGLFFVILLSVFSILPFFQQGFFPIHDDTQVARVYEMGKALKDGMFPVRWVPDLGYGYGYPVFNFYAPFAYYFGGFVNLLGFDALLATKIMMITGIVLAGIFMYLLAREFWGEIGGLVSGLFYMYAPYHALDIYVRGDVSEFYAYAFIPLMFLGFYKLFKITKAFNFQLNKKVWKWVIVGAVGYAGVILSHNLTAMMVTPFLLIVILLYCYIAYKDKKYLSMFYVLCSMFLGILLSAFYWLPAIFEMKYTNVLSQIGGGANFRDHFVCIQQLWNSPWGFGGSTKGCIDGMSFKLGKFHILLSVIALFFLLILKIRSKLFIHFNNIYHLSDRIIAVLFSICGLIFSIFLMLEISKSIWEVLPLMAFFQYPWRFLLLSSFFSSFLAGSVIWFIEYVIARSSAKQNDEAIYIGRRLPRFARNDGKRVLPYIVSAVLVFLLIFLNGKLFNPQTIISKTAADYTSDYALKWVASKTSDEYLPKNFVKPKSFSEIQKNKNYSRNYPEQTFIQKLANFLSLTGMLILILGIIYTGRQRINEKTIS